MNRTALVIAALALVVLAVPGAAGAADRPEWTDCKLDKVPKQISRGKLLRQGLPVTVTCRTAVTFFVPIRIDDPRVKLDGDARNSDIGTMRFSPSEAGQTHRLRIKIAKGWPRRAIRSRRRVRVLAASRGIDCVEVDLAVVRGEREPDLTLFAA